MNVISNTRQSVATRTAAGSPRTIDMIVSRIVAAFVLCLLIVWPVSAHAAGAATGPTLSIVPAPGYRLAVRGMGWPAGARLHLLARTPGGVDSVHLRVTSRGYFLVGLNNVDPCAGARFDAFDAFDHHATVRAPQTACASPGRSFRPLLAVVRGGHLPHLRLTVFGPALPRGVQTLYVGDRLYVWQPGQGRPSVWPRSDSTYLQLIRRGRTVDQDCSGMPAATPADCNAGFWWEWMSVRPGHTEIDLVPACRQSRIRCGSQEAVIEVQIED
ncbi:MAG: hypothetical protein NVS2B16_03160 [Chloroflexota bacterium]